MSFPSKTALAAILRDCVADPRKPGPHKILADMGDAEYYRKRAIECLMEAGMGMTTSRIKDAIYLLTLALYFSKEKKISREK